MFNQSVLLAEISLTAADFSAGVFIERVVLSQVAGSGVGVEELAEEAVLVGIVTKDLITCLYVGLRVDFVVTSIKGLLCEDAAAVEKNGV